ncbi:MAG: type II toxin-antitoxin system HicB family antitoxin [Chloroflexota bacterium]
MKDTYVYPAFLIPHENQICVLFPDLPGCQTSGDDYPHAIRMAKEAMSLHLWGLEDDGDPIPDPTPIDQLRIEPGSVPVMIDVFMPPVRNDLSSRSVKKTLTVPKWLNDLAESHGVNFSGVLQDALKQRLGISDRPHSDRRTRKA